MPDNLIETYLGNDLLAVFVMLITGLAANIASLSMVYKMLGEKALLIYLFSISVCALLFGFLTDLLYKGLNISAKASIGKTADLILLQAEIIAAIIFTILLVNAIIREYRTPVACTCTNSL